MPHEFRVRWQREGRQPAFQIYQSWEAACRKVRSIMAMDEVKRDTERFADMPDLVGPPELQVREVGAWAAHDYQPKATEFDVKGVREHVYYRYGEGAPPPEPAPSGGEFEFEVPF